MLWICDQNGVRITVMFQLLLSSLQAFSLSHPTSAVRRLGVHKKMREDTARTADSQVTKGKYQTIWHHVQHIEPGVEEGRWRHLE